MKNKVATVIFLNKQKEILLYLRDNKSSIPYPNYWALLGGHLENDENPLNALKREIKEEINYDIKSPVFIDYFDDGAGDIVYVYKDYINKKVKGLHLREGQKLGFFNFDDLMFLKIPPIFKKFLIKNKNKILF